CALPIWRRSGVPAGRGSRKPWAASAMRRHFARVLSRTGLLQIDSVSAVVRAHYMPLYSRLGPYPLSLLDNAAVTRKRTVFEYWAHEASFLPVETYPLMRWRMQRAEQGDEMYLGLAKWGREHGA
ncbi:winged helix-turn-helix domain-containing protein, partial [bacterium M00.F.Ca.ET.180.01.1.1]